MREVQAETWEQAGSESLHVQAVVCLFTVLEATVPAGMHAAGKGVQAGEREHHRRQGFFCLFFQSFFFSSSSGLRKRIRGGGGEVERRGSACLFHAFSLPLPACLPHAPATATPRHATLSPLTATYPLTTLATMPPPSSVFCRSFLGGHFLLFSFLYAGIKQCVEGGVSWKQKDRVCPSFLLF